MRDGPGCANMVLQFTDNIQLRCFMYLDLRNMSDIYNTLPWRTEHCRSKLFKTFPRNSVVIQILFSRKYNAFEDDFTYSCNHSGSRFWRSGRIYHSQQCRAHVLRMSVFPRPTLISKHLTILEDPDNSPPGAAIAYDCGRGYIAGE